MRGRGINALQPTSRAQNDTHVDGRAAAARGRARTLGLSGETLDSARDSGYSVAMLSPVLNRAQAVERLAGCEREIRALGVSRLALFGSVLRGQPRVDSDVDVLVEFVPGAKTYTQFLALSDLLEQRLGRRVELVTKEALSPFIGPRILAEASDVLRAA